MATFWLLLKRLTRALWFLPALFSIFAVAVVMFALFASEILPEGVNLDNLPVDISTDAVRSILGIVGSSMLAVTVFSLSTFVNLLTNAAQTSSPRMLPIILQDRAAQTSISVFIGAFLFSVVGIIGLSGDLYNAAGRIIMFASTILVIGAVIWALLSWIREISVLGRISDIIERAEDASRHTLKRVGPGALYGCGPRRSAPKDAQPIFAGSIGFVQHFDTEKLQAAAEKDDLRIHIEGRPGSYVDFNSVLAWVEGSPRQDCLRRIRSSFLIGVVRTFENDPTYGFTVLADIARRALSPAINDPKTAVHVLTVQTRLIGEWLRDGNQAANPSEFDRLTITPMKPAALLDAAFCDIARDAAPSLDATLATLRGLSTLVSTSPEELSVPASRLASEIAVRAEKTLTHPLDVERVQDTAQKLAHPKMI